MEPELCNGPWAAEAPPPAPPTPECSTQLLLPPPPEAPAAPPSAAVLLLQEPQEGPCLTLYDLPDPLQDSIFVHLGLGDLATASCASYAFRALCQVGADDGGAPGRGRSHCCMPSGHACSPGFLRRPTGQGLNLLLRSIRALPSPTLGSCPSELLSLLSLHCQPPTDALLI